jgi:hypothetical protein
MSRLTISFPIVSFAARWLTVNMPDCHELVLVQYGYRSRNYLFDGESVTGHEEHKCRKMMVPPVGLEPTRSREHRILSWVKNGITYCYYVVFVRLNALVC